MTVRTEQEWPKPPDAKPILDYLQKPLVATVDDDPAKRAINRIWLEYMGCVVQEFEGGEDFLANGNRESACVLLNEQMPGLSGHQTFHQMRQNGWLMPVISESVFFPDARERYGNGQVAHLNAPYTLAEFEEAIRTALGAAGFCLSPKGVVALDFDLLTWNRGTIPLLARYISEERAFDSLPILADALEEAGCENTDIINHCR